LTHPVHTFRVPVLPLLAGLFACSAAGVGIGLAIASATRVVSSGGEMMTPALIAFGAAVVGSIGGVALLNLIATRVDRFGAGFLVSSGARMMLGLVLCVATAQVLGLKGATLWYCFLGAGLLCLFFETGWAVRMNNRLTMQHVSSRTSSVSAATGVAS